MKQTERYTVDVPIEFAFEWLLHGNYFFSSLNVKSFKYDFMETGGRFIAYEEIKENRFVPIKGEYRKLESPSHFQIRLWFPGGEQTIECQLQGIDRTTSVQATIHRKYYSFFLTLGNLMFRKRKRKEFQTIIETEKNRLEEAFGINALNTKPAGLKIDQAEMDEKWNEFRPGNPFYSWVRPDI